jgi:hypothetical protein
VRVRVCVFTSLAPGHLDGLYSCLVFKSLYTVGQFFEDTITSCGSVVVEVLCC